MAGEKVMDVERAAFAQRIADVHRSVSKGDTYTMQDFAVFQERVQEVYEEFYGRWPGDTQARFYRAIQMGCRMAVLAALEEDARFTDALVRKYQNELDAIFNA